MGESVQEPPIPVRICRPGSFWRSSLTSSVVVHLLLSSCRHIEGKGGFGNLVSLPDDLFADMHALALVHLGVHSSLPRLPSFDGLSNLNQMLLAYLFSVTELPPLAPLKRLERVDFVYLPALRSIPDLSPLEHNLKALSIFRPMQICCNGFVGACDLTHPYCSRNPEASIPHVDCLDANESYKRATPATTRLFQVHSAAAICAAASMSIPEVPTRERVDMCAGTLFRRCELSGTLQANGSRLSVTGICFNTRMQVIACNSDPYKIQVRRAQIQRRVGLPCDPEIEAWLGCT